MLLKSILLPNRIQVVPDDGGPAASGPTIKKALFRSTVETSMRADATLDATLFGTLFGPQASFQMGGLPKVVGPQAVSGFVGGFFQSVQKVEHQLLEAWEMADTLIYRADVTFTKLDGRRLSAPYVNVLKFADGALREYQVFIDMSPLA